MIGKLYGLIDSIMGPKPNPLPADIVDLTDYLRDLNLDEDYENLYTARFSSKATKDQIAWGNNEDPNGVLKIGETYAVDSFDIRSSHTKIMLKVDDEVLGPFNSVNFEFGLKDDEDDPINYPRMEGSYARLNEKPASDNPYDSESEEHEQWHQGWVSNL